MSLLIIPILERPENHSKTFRFVNPLLDTKQKHQLLLLKGTSISSFFRYFE